MLATARLRCGLYHPSTRRTSRLWSYDARHFFLGLTIRRQHDQNAGTNGIQIIRSEVGHDGTWCRQPDRATNNPASADRGQYGKLNAFRARRVIVRGNIIRPMSVSGIRGNQVDYPESATPAPGEVALDSEFRLRGHGDRAENWRRAPKPAVSVATFMRAGPARGVQGKHIRNIQPKDPKPGRTNSPAWELFEADPTVTGNVA